MPKPAATHPTRRIAAVPNRRPAAASKTTRAKSANQRPDDPMAGTAAERTVPSAIRRPLVPAPQLLLSPLEVWLADGKPDLGSPYGGAGARVVGGYRERQAGPDGIEVKEEGDRDAEMRSQQGAAGRPEIGGYVSEHERERQDHENQAAEHVVHEQHPADVRPRQVLGDEPDQDHGGREAPVPDDEVREREYAGEARPPDPGIAQVLDPRNERLPGPVVEAEVRVLRVIEHRPRQERPRPPRGAVRMRGGQGRVIDVRLPLVLDQVGQVLELAPREEWIPRCVVDGERDHHQSDEGEQHIYTRPSAARDGRTVPTSPAPPRIFVRAYAHVDMPSDRPGHEQEDDARPGGEDDPLRRDPEPKHDAQQNQGHD